jgi:hypothetical protein
VSLREHVTGWRRFSRKEAVSSKGKIELLEGNFVNCTIRRPVTYAQALKEIAQHSEVPIPIDHLPDSFNQRSHARGVVAFGHPGDYFDLVAQQFENLYWTISNSGLRFFVRSPLDDLGPFDRLAGELISAARAEVAGRKKLPPPTYLRIATRLDQEGFIPLETVEKPARMVLASYNQRNPGKAIHSFSAALQTKNPSIKRAILRRLYRASEKYKRLANS